MKNEIIKIAVNPVILMELERIAKATSTPVDQVIDYSFTLMIALHTKSKEERIKIINTMF